MRRSGLSIEAIAGDRRAALSSRLSMFVIGSLVTSSCWGGDDVQLYGVTGDGGTISESLFLIDTDDASALYICTFGRGDDGETIAFNPDDGRIYHSSGANGVFDPKTGEGVVFEYTDIAGNGGTSCAAVDIDISTTDLVEGEVQGLTYWQEERIFLWSESGGDLFRVASSGEATFVGDMNHQAKGLALLDGITDGGPLLYTVEGDGGDELRVVDPDTAEVLDTIDLTIAGGIGGVHSGNGLAVHPTTGVLWGVLSVEFDVAVGVVRRMLVTIDPATAVATIVGELPQKFAGIAFAEEVPICPIVDLVVAMDTSSSMDDEAEALCADIEDLLEALADQGIVVNATLLGVTEDGKQNPVFPCLTDSVLSLLGGDVPRKKDFLNDTEDWAPATAIIADRFDWTPGSLRLIIPISDEDPQDGDGCDDGDADAIQNAINQCVEHKVIASPIISEWEPGRGCPSEECACIIPLARKLALETGGVVVESTDPEADLIEAILGIILSACGLIEDDCNDNGVPDDVETAPIYEIDPDADPSAQCEDAPYIGPGILYEATSITDEALLPDTPGYFFCGLLVGRHDVFYRYVPCWDGLVFITVEGPPINWLYGVYDDCPPTKECLIDCNEIDHFEVIFEAEKGKEYWIRIAGQYFVTGDFELYMLGPDAMLNPTDCNRNGIPDECECLADVNDDGEVDRYDLDAVILAFGTMCDGCPEDVDGSGVVDETDAIIVIDSMGPCPFVDDAR